MAPQKLHKGVSPWLGALVQAEQVLLTLIDGLGASRRLAESGLMKVYARRRTAKRHAGSKRGSGPTLLR
jgi:hypothetical protein